MHIRYNVFAIVAFVSREEQTQIESINTQDVVMLPHNIASYRNPSDPIAQGAWRLPGTTAARSSEGIDIDPVALLIKAITTQVGVEPHAHHIRCIAHMEKRVARPHNFHIGKKFTESTRYYYVTIPYEEFFSRNKGFGFTGGAKLNLDFTPHYILHHASYYKPHKDMLRTLASQKDGISTKNVQ